VTGLDSIQPFPFLSIITHVPRAFRRTLESFGCENSRHAPRRAGAGCPLARSKENQKKTKATTTLSSDLTVAVSGAGARRGEIAAWRVGARRWRRSARASRSRSCWRSARGAGAWTTRATRTDSVLALGRSRSREASRATLRISDREARAGARRRSRPRRSSPLWTSSPNTPRTARREGTRFGRTTPRSRSHLLISARARRREARRSSRGGPSDQPRGRASGAGWMSRTRTARGWTRGAEVTPHENADAHRAYERRSVGPGVDVVAVAASASDARSWRGRVYATFDIENGVFVFDAPLVRGESHAGRGRLPHDARAARCAAERDVRARRAEPRPATRGVEFVVTDVEGVSSAPASTLIDVEPGERPARDRRERVPRARPGPRGFVRRARATGGRPTGLLRRRGFRPGRRHLLRLFVRYDRLGDGTFADFPDGDAERIEADVSRNVHHQKLERELVHAGVHGRG